MRRVMIGGDGMTIEGIQAQIAQMDREIDRWAQQSRQAEANWNYARGVRAGLSVWLEKLQASLAEGSGDKKELSAEEAQQPHPSPPQKGGDGHGVG